MAKNEMEAEFLRKRELIIEKISKLKSQNMSIGDFYKCTNDIIFEEDEADQTEETELLKTLNR